MKTTARAVRTAAFLLLLSATTTIAFADFCWKATEGRGVGTIPTRCAAGKENDAALCYPACRSGMQGVGPVCWGRCPSSTKDVGVSCVKGGPYGVGGGYPWKFGDALNDSGMYDRCQKDKGRGNCEKWGAVVYPKCAAGFHKVGCCICSPDCPSGFADNGVGCTKPSYGRGAGTIPDVCNGTDQNDHGLCYQACPTAFSQGLGPVCWKKCQGAAPFECGGGCAKDLVECRLNLVTQAMATVQFVINLQTQITTGGLAMGFKSLQAGGKQAFMLAMKGIVKALAIPNVTRENVANAVKQAWPDATPQQSALLMKILVGEDFDFTAIDVTGLASLARSFTAPICK